MKKKKTITAKDYENLKNYAYKFIKDKELANDLIQETFIKINDLNTNTTYNIDNITNFSKTVFRNLFYRYIQKKQQQYELFDEEIDSLKVDVEDEDYKYNDTYDTLLDNLTTSVSLNDKLLVEHANGSSVKELSIKYNYSENAIKCRMHKRRLKIKYEYEHK